MVLPFAATILCIRHACSDRVGVLCQSAIDFLGGGRFGCTRIPVETTRRSTIERKQWRCIRFSNHPAAVCRLEPSKIWALQDSARRSARFRGSRRRYAASALPPTLAIPGCGRQSRPFRALALRSGRFRGSCRARSARRAGFHTWGPMRGETRGTESQSESWWRSGKSKCQT